MVGFHRVHPVSPVTVKVVVILAYLNSLINPCLYMIINRDVRSQLKKIFRCGNQRHLRQQSVDTEGSSSTNYQSLSLRRIQKMFTLSTEDKSTEQSTLSTEH